jgi:hypothetical protein
MCCNVFQKIFLSGDDLSGEGECHMYVCVVRTLLLIATAVVMILFFVGDLSANSFSSSPYNAIGFSGDFIADSGGTPAADVGLNLSYRCGFISLVSAFLSADAGYQVREKSFNGKTGVQAMIIFFGIEGGYTHKYVFDEKNNYPGGYCGLICAIPLHSDTLISLSLGGNFYKKSESEFYLRLTTVFNLPEQS